MEFNIEVRKKQLENLDQFISSSRDKVQSILEILGWTANEVVKDKKLIPCSLDSSHKIPASAVSKHISKCCLRKEGYDFKEQFLSEPTHLPGQFILIDDHKKNEIFVAASNSNKDFTKAWNGQDADPKTSSRLLSTYSYDERLALYDYAVKSTCGPPAVPEFNVITSNESSGDKGLSYEELLAQQRDAKRRRIKYKSVYTNHKSQTEVTREVIEGQMELYEAWVKGKEIKTEPSTKTPEPSKPTPASPTPSHKSNEKEPYERSTISRNSTHSSGSKSINRHDDYRHEKSYKKAKRDDDDRHRQNRRDYPEKRHNSSRYTSSRKYGSPSMKRRSHDKSYESKSRKEYARRDRNGYRRRDS